MKWGSLSKFVFAGAILALAFGVTTKNAFAIPALCPGSATGIFNADFDPICGAFGIQQDWGIPGVSAGITPYLGTVPAYGLDVSFTGTGTIDPNSILLGNGAGCEGSTFGGTTFCTIGPFTSDIWLAFQTGPRSIEFLAQDPSFYLSPGQDFFVNVFFNGDPPSADFIFLDNFSPTPTPLPAALPLFAGGLGVIGLLARRRKRKYAAAIAAA